MPKTDPNIVVGSKVREFVKELGFRADGDLVEAASTLLCEALRKAASRAQASGRATIRPTDL